VEEEARNQTVNAGSFVLLEGAVYDWWDVPAYYHNDSSTLGFADGHAERHKWRDPDTVKLMKGEIRSDPQPQFNEDLHWMVRGYLPR
jgi:prepilin-type processing-associated H-X9-DG protein